MGKGLALPAAAHAQLASHSSILQFPQIIEGEDRIENPQNECFLFEL